MELFISTKKVYRQKIKAYLQQQENCRRLMRLSGIGVINATAIFATAGDARHFETARNFAVWLGLTPRQQPGVIKSSMGGITRRGNRYLRKQLIHKASAYIYRARKRKGTLYNWINSVVARRGQHKNCAALAHKLACTAWAILTKQESCQPKMD